MTIHLRILERANVISYQMNVRTSDLFEGRRFKTVVKARDRLIRELREEGLSLKEIGRHLDLDHSTVQASLKRSG